MCHNVRLSDTNLTARNVSELPAGNDEGADTCENAMYITLSLN